MTVSSIDGSNRALDGLLAGYAMGTLSPALHVLVASHLTVSREGRTFVASLEAAGGSELDRASPAALRDPARIFETIIASPGIGEHPAERDDALLPVPLARFVGRPGAELPWRTLIPGVRRHVIESTRDTEAALFWIRAGRRMPAHTHEGLEVTLVLQGGLSDVTGHYHRGDISIADPDVDHRPVTDPDADCLCFAVAEGPRRLTGPVGRWLEHALRRRHS